MSNEHPTIDPAAVIALATAAGLDPAPLQEQVEQDEQRVSSEEITALKARIAELEAKREAEEPPPPDVHREFADRLREAQSRWLHIPGGQDGSQAA
jgi:hypothetical protein